MLQPHWWDSCPPCVVLQLLILRIFLNFPVIGFAKGGLTCLLSILINGQGLALCPP